MTYPVLGSGNSGYFIQRSVRLRGSASAYFSRTPATAGNRTTWTWSGWVKRGIINSSNAVAYPLFALPTGTTDTTWFEFRFLADSLYVAGYLTNWRITTQLFRDPSAWYHIVLAIDTTQATANNRIRLYVNGSEVTAFSTINNPAQNALLGMNQAAATYMGFSNTQYYDGYLAEINFIDGQALTPASFGQFNPTTGVWIPKQYSGTYGTNGFYEKFTDNSAATAAALGKDFSGNGNNWTPNNISVTAGVTYDSMTDVPTLTSPTQANYCTLNPLASSVTALTPTQGNLYLGNNATNNFSVVCTIGVSSGKWYWELKTDSTNTMLGITSISSIAPNTGPFQVGTQAKVYYSLGTKYDNGTSSSYGATFTTGDLIAIALDLDAGTLTFYKNNVSQGVAFTGLSGTYFPVFGGPNAYNVGYVNFGQQPFIYTPPSGHNRINTFNLPTATIPNGAKQFAATLYTGTGATQTIANTNNGVNFQPDFVWIKGRSGATNHSLYDSVRGTTKQLIITAAAETTEATGLTTFGSNGFTVGALANLNTNAATYVAWNWKASNAAAVTNTSGSISSQVSANPSAGFSIVTYTGNGSTGTIGHGLGVAPNMFIVKQINSGANSWFVYTSTTGAGNWLSLNSTGAITANTAIWNNTSPTSSVFSVGASTATNAGSGLYLAYCFANITGYSKFGSYLGNALADGPMVITGFRPRFVMIKEATTARGWIMFDTSRSPYNVVDNYLFAESSGAAGTVTLIDILSNGFKVRSTNLNVNDTTSSTFIYMAFAENPFQYSLAR